MAGSEVADRGSHLVVRTPANPGYWWGNFVLLAAPPAPGELAHWVAAFEAEFPQAAHLSLGVDGTAGGTGDPAELARLGLAAEVSTVLTATRLRPAPERHPERHAERHAEVELRPLAVESDADWAQALELGIASNGGDAAPPEYRAFLARKVAEHRCLCVAGHGVWFGAFVAGTMRAGLGVFGSGGGDGSGDGDRLARYQDVETHPDFRRQGLATALVHRAGTWATGELGARRLVVVADPAYHAIHLYRALGFTDAERQVQLSRQ
ncbi:GNAT family N-acetyltransferase [Kitasatospora sp. LaBMicrA B282]|uniref:GNAT family N-acetyltransferase n=1 Tax=Kitasatospora sp. LaBMicrA B282 TaxID=3420949 RepID=UPI003D0DD3D9